MTSTEQGLVDRIAELEEDVEALWGLSMGAMDTERQNAFQAEAEEAELELERVRCELDALQADADPMPLPGYVVMPEAGAIDADAIADMVADSEG